MKWLFALLPCLLVACGSDVVKPCPTGWLSQSSGATCIPPDATVNAFQAKLGTGLFGFVRETHQVVSSGTTHVTSTLMAGVKVQLAAYKGQPPSQMTCAFSPSPIASTITDADGVYALPAPPGEWVIESCTESGLTSVAFDSITEQDLDLDDVPQ